MAIDRKFGKLEIKGIRKKEPVFVIRAQDATALGNIEGYIARAEQHGCSEAFIQGIGDVVTDFQEWQAANADKVKNPD